ncbi:MAG TPA: hypothetical protein VHI77_07620 [Solirubrobacterales bacterium]|jgi:hypothetical protein|nr:hypothetical protein [Solirubrobacterales bacterium]
MRVEDAVENGQTMVVEYWQAELDAIDDQIVHLGGVPGRVLDGPIAPGDDSPDAEADLNAIFSSSQEPTASVPESGIIQTDPWADNISTPEDPVVSGLLFVPPLPWEDSTLPGSSECSKFQIGGNDSVPLCAP